MKVSLINYIKLLGADLVGIANLENTTTGYDSTINTGISIAIKLNPNIVSTIKHGPTMDYFHEYSRVNQELDEIAQVTCTYIKELGYTAILFCSTGTQNIDTLSTILPHKTVARIAGLGWIGKSALLVTKEYGPAIRLITVLTNMPLEADKAIIESNCGNCNACKNACDAKAIMGTNWKQKTTRDEIYNAYLCHESARLKSDALSISPTICGMCIYACPYTQKYIQANL